VLLEPGEIALFGAVLDFAQEVDGFRLVAGLGWVVRRDDHFDFDGDNISVGLNETLAFDAFAGNFHGDTLVKKMDGDELGDATFAEVGPNCFALSAVG